MIRRLTVSIVLLAIGTTLLAEPRERHRTTRSEPNWIIERQSAGQVQGVPTSRRIIGKREIDIYPNGLMFEKGNVVGVQR